VNPNIDCVPLPVRLVNHEGTLRMGLDIFFGTPGGDDSFFYLRDHWDFFSLICTPEPQQYDPEYTDFLITHHMLNRIEANLLADCVAEGLSLDLVPDTLPNDFDDWDAPEVPWTELLPCYLCIVKDFRVQVNQFGFIICGWSA
jgi:hypothetical protein